MQVATAVRSTANYHHRTSNQDLALLEALLDSFSRAVIVCDRAGNVEYSNQAAQQKLNPGLLDISIGHAGTANGVRFQRAVRALRTTAAQSQRLKLQTADRVCVFRVDFLDDQQRWLRLVSCDGGANASQALALAAEQYQFTPAEMDIARHLLHGRSSAEIAALRCSSRETVRSQIKSLLQKTGVHRQAALIALLGGY